MRKYSFIASLLLIAATSCNNAQPTATTNEPAQAAMPAAEAPKYTKGAKMDPVCEMELDNTWTESTVYMNDTIRFCSQNCKMAFVARPEKYIKK